MTEIELLLELNKRRAKNLRWEDTYEGPNDVESISAAYHKALYGDKAPPPEPVDKTNNFTKCPTCGQSVRR